MSNAESHMENTIATEARGAAALLSNLSKNVIKTFEVDDVQERTRQIVEICAQIQLEMVPIVTWVELEQPAAADLLRRRLFTVFEQAKKAVSLTIPEYSGGVVDESATERPSEGAKYVTTMSVTAGATAASINTIAKEVEARQSAKGSRAETKDASDGDSENRIDEAPKLETAHRKAYLAFEYAQTMNEKELKDHEAYEWLAEYGIKNDKKSGELRDYELPPKFDTWTRYLSCARKTTDQLKHRPRRGRSGRSVVSEGEV